MTINDRRHFDEWIETDGLGGFASGTVDGRRTRRYHALLLTARNPPAGRVVLVNGFDAWVETPVGTFPISTQYYEGDIESPRGHQFLSSFSIDPWPTWRYKLTDEIAIIQELMVTPRVPGTAMRWSVAGMERGVRLHLRPFLSGRDFHDMHHANDAFRPVTMRGEHALVWQPYRDLPEIHVQSNADFEASFRWYNAFLYTAEQDRGLDAGEDLASPGEFHWDLSVDQAYLLLSAGKPFSELYEPRARTARETFPKLETNERVRRAKAGREQLAIDAYVVNRGAGKTLIAGYPWFGDWGRDTFIAMRGLCLAATDDLRTARDILVGWAGAVSDGMLPNRFPDQGDTPEYNSVDASLWYVIAVGEYLAAAQDTNQRPSTKEKEQLRNAVELIVDGYSVGTRFGIHLDDDGLLAAGEPGVQLTWMDAKVGDWVVTPRIGKPVEVQALWLNALHVAGTFSTRWEKPLQQGRASFSEKFWHKEGGYLFDVVDTNHEPGHVDDAFRPNQIFAVGGLPLVLLDDEKARQVVDGIEQRLLTPVGLRSLCPNHPDYKPRYEGGVLERDSAYHQGTVWPWLIGPFVEAWLRVRKNTPAARKEATQRFLEPLERHINVAGVGHISEICDAEPPHAPRGCPFQAWSYGEYLRIKRGLLDHASGDIGGPCRPAQDPNIPAKLATDENRKTT